MVESYAAAGAAATVEEVRRFLDSLKRELPEVFRPRAFSKRFWGQVARWCPDYRQRRRRLRENGRPLRGEPREAARP